jgi:hypothetical protein
MFYWTPEYGQPASLYLTWKCNTQFIQQLHINFSELNSRLYMDWLSVSSDRLNNLLPPSKYNYKCMQEQVNGN